MTNMLLKTGNKGGWIRIFEAFIAIILIIGAVLIVINRSPASSTKGGAIASIEHSVLSEIAENDSLRQKALNDHADELNSYFRSKISSTLSFEIRICSVEDVCGLQDYIKNKEVYADEIILSATINQYNPKKVKILAWENYGKN